MSHEQLSKQDWRRAVYGLLAEAKQVAIERREHQREPFFHPASLSLVENGQERTYTCFTRDLSPTGVGLLHNMPLPQERATLAIRNVADQWLHFGCRIVWSRPCGEGWYISGAYFGEDQSERTK